MPSIVIFALSLDLIIVNLDKKNTAKALCSIFQRKNRAKKGGNIPPVVHNKKINNIK